MLASVLAFTACQTGEDEDPKEEPVEVVMSVYPEVGGLGTVMNLHLQSSRSQFIFGETSLDLGDGVTVESVTVHDGYTAVASISIEAGAELGARDATIGWGSKSETIADAFEVIEESIRIDPDNAKMGEIVEVAIVGSATEWEPGYTWTGFGDGVDVVDFQVLSETLGVATVATTPLAHFAMFNSSGLESRNSSIFTPYWRSNIIQL